MMPKLVELARASIAESAVWRDCAGCGALAAMAPEANRCDRCQSPPPVAAGGSGSRPAPGAGGAA